MLSKIIITCVLGAIAYVILGVMHKKYFSKLALISTVLSVILILTPYIKPAYDSFNNINNKLQKVEKIKDKPNKMLDFGNKDNLSLDKIRQFKENVEKNKWINWGIDLK